MVSLRFFCIALFFGFPALSAQMPQTAEKGDTSSAIIVLQKGLQIHSISAWQRLFNDSEIYFFDVEKHFQQGNEKINLQIENAQNPASIDIYSQDWLLVVGNSIVASGNDLPQARDLKNYLHTFKVLNKLFELENCQQANPNNISIQLKIFETHARRIASIHNLIPLQPDGHLSVEDDQYLFGNYVRLLDLFLSLDRRHEFLLTNMYILPTAALRASRAIKTRYEKILPELLHILKLNPVNAVLFSSVEHIENALGVSSIIDTLDINDFIFTIYDAPFSSPTHFVPGHRMGQRLFGYGKDIKDSNEYKKLIDLLRGLWKLQSTRNPSTVTRMTISQGQPSDEDFNRLQARMKADAEANREVLSHSWDGYLQPLLEALLVDKANDPEVFGILANLDERWKKIGAIELRIRRLLAQLERDDILGNALYFLQMSSANQYLEPWQNSVKIYIRPGGNLYRATSQDDMFKYLPLLSALKYYGYPLTTLSGLNGYRDNPSIPRWMYNSSSWSDNPDDLCILVFPDNITFIFKDHQTDFNTLLSDLNFAGYDRPIDKLNKLLHENPNNPRLQLSKMQTIQRMIADRMMQKAPPLLNSVAYERTEDLIDEYIDISLSLFSEKTSWFVYYDYVALSGSLMQLNAATPRQISRLREILSDIGTEIEKQPESTNLHRTWAFFATLSKNDLNSVLSKINACDYKTTIKLRLSFLLSTIHQFAKGNAWQKIVDEYSSVIYEITEAITPLIINPSVIPKFTDANFVYGSEYEIFQDNSDYLFFNDWLHVWQQFTRACFEVGDGETLIHFIRKHRENILVKDSLSEIRYEAPYRKHKFSVDIYAELLSVLN
ncbi:MAG: hypothetical protein FWG02_07460 [Holophagaceae bacterium]|nr:hypothetical protein [Holophagaceae bacterium]